MLPSESVLNYFRGVNPGAAVRGFNLSFWTEFKLELPSRPVNYGPANYFLFGITGCVIGEIGLTFCGGISEFIICLVPFWEVIYYRSL